MPLTIHPVQAAGIKALLDLPESSSQEILSAYDSAEPEFNASDLALKVTEITGLPRHLVLSVTALAINLYRVLSEEVESVDFGRYIDSQVLPTLRSTNSLPSDNADGAWQRLRSFLLAALSKKTIATTAKAGSVLTEHERIFNSVKIMTDLRPVWSSDPTTAPDAALIIHMMKITQRDTRGIKSEFYFALDSNDILALKGAIARAEQKEGSLRELMKKTSLPILHPKATY